MIRELNRNNKTNWYEKIQLEMTLQDLQILYDCIGAVPIEYIKIKHKNTPFNLMESMYDDISVNLYDGLHTIISEHNGVTDDDEMVNIYLGLEMVKSNE